MNKNASNVKLLCALLSLLGFFQFAYSHKIVKRQGGGGSTVVCGQPLYTGTVSETAAAGTFILTAAATSTLNSALTWSITNVDTALQRFTINSATGVVTVAQQLTRRLDRSALEFLIRATDNTNQNYCQSTVRVNILPVVSTSTGTTGTIPFGQSNYQFTATSCFPGATVGQVFATTTGQTYTYSISSGNSYYTINPQTGIITVLQQAPSGIQSFTVSAISSTGQSGTVPVTVTNNNCAGTTTGVTFQQTSYSLTLSSCTQNAFVGSVLATSTLGGLITYSLPSGSPYFTINQQTGQLTTLQIPPTGTQSLIVQAISSTGQTASVPVTVFVSCTGTTGTGVFFQQPSQTLTLSTCTQNAFVGSVIATSTNGGFVTYSLPSGSGYFTINPTTGQITTLQIPPTGTQTLTVQATSSNGQTAIAQLTVFVSCNGGIGGTTPVFSSQFYQFTAATCTAGSQVGQVYATASGAAVTYQTIGGSSYFYVNPSTGAITVQSVPPIGTPQTFSVQAFSSSGQTATVPVTVTTSCTGTGTIGTIPTFQQPSYSLQATSCTSGTFVGSVFATSTTAAVIYSIDGVSPYYAINPTSGQISILSPPPAGVQTISVRAQANGYSSAVPVSITSSCSGTGGTGGFQQSSYFFTASNCAPGNQVGQVFATPTSGTPFYTISGGSGSYSINPSTGQITTTGSGISGTQTFTVTATSSTGISLGSVQVSVTSTCSSTSGLTFGQSSYSFTASSCTFGSVVGQVFVSSNPTGGSLSYSLAGGTTGQYTINPSTGQISVASNAVSGGTTTLQVQATSSTGQSGIVPVTITSSCSSGGGSLTFGQSTYFLTASSCNFGSIVGQIFANNPSGGSTSYFLSSGNTGQYSINPSTGQITVASTISAGTTTTLQVQATTSSGQTGSVPVTITANCAGGGGGGTGGRAPPVFSQSSYQGSIQCSATATQRVGVISASNAQQDSMNYLVTPSNQFYVDPNSGEIRTIIPLRTAGTYQLTASATDPYGTTTSVPITVTVTGSC